MNKTALVLLCMITSSLFAAQPPADVPQNNQSVDALTPAEYNNFSDALFTLLRANRMLNWGYILFGLVNLGLGIAKEVSNVEIVRWNIYFGAFILLWGGVNILPCPKPSRNKTIKSILAKIARILPPEKQVV